MEQEIQNKVIQLAKRHSDKMIEDTGYLHEVLVETGRIKKDSGKDDIIKN